MKTKLLLGILMTGMLFLGQPADTVADAAGQAGSIVVKPGTVQLNLLSPAGEAYGEGIAIRVIRPDTGQVVAQGTSDVFGRVTLSGLDNGNYFLSFGQGRVPFTVSPDALVDKLNVVASPSQLGLTGTTPGAAGGTTGAGGAAGGSTAVGASPTLLWTAVIVGGVMGLTGLTVGLISNSNANAAQSDADDAMLYVLLIQQPLSP